MIHADVDEDDCRPAIKSATIMCATPMSGTRCCNLHGQSHLHSRKLLLFRYQIQVWKADGSLMYLLELIRACPNDYLFNCSSLLERETSGINWIEEIDSQQEIRKTE